MLTSDLAMSWRRGDKIFPRLIRTDDAGYLRDAENLIAIFEDGVEKTRGELDFELEEYVGTGTDYRILRGFIKLLTDKCEFETSAPAEPEEVRQKVFLAARAFQPVLPDSAQRREILRAVAKSFDTDAETIEANLYADLSDNQKLISFEQVTPEDLLDRYNLAQAQALLYKCVELKIRVAPGDSAENYRAIFGWIKHFGLIHSVAGNAANGYEITLTGAASLFHRSQKYGIRMAVFLPALLLCAGWKMRAEIAQKEGNVFYELSSEQTDLSSCYFDEPPYKNPDIEKLKKAWEKSSSQCRLEENREVVDLGKTAFIPDLVLISPENEKVYTDVLGFWTPKSLKKRLEEFRAAAFHKFIFAASEELRGSREEPLWTSENVLFYKTRIEPHLLIKLAEELKKAETRR